MNKNASLARAVAKLIRRGWSKKSVETFIAQSQHARKNTNLSRQQHSFNLRNWRLPDAYKNRIMQLNKYFKPKDVQNLTDRYMQNVNSINKFYNLKQNYKKNIKRGLSRAQAYKRAKQENSWHKEISQFSDFRGSKLTEEDIQDLFKQYRDAANGVQLKPIGKPIKASDISSNPNFSDPNYVYGGKPKKFIDFYRAGRPVFMTPYFKQALSYLTDGTKFQYIFRAPRNLIRRQGKPTIFTKHLGLTDNDYRIQRQTNSVPSMRGIYLPEDYQTVMDNTSGLAQKLFKVYKKLDNGMYQQHKILPITDKVLSQLDKAFKK